ncbi:MAG: hypothetical protein HYV39_03365 [Candidatus Levybacteria bacterium]|nr:hypothetical protein [Candidatus Levybacteria bacterium]
MKGPEQFHPVPPEFHPFHEEADGVLVEEYLIPPGAQGPEQVFGEQNGEPPSQNPQLATPHYRIVAFYDEMPTHRKRKSRAGKQAVEAEPPLSSFVENQNTSLDQEAPTFRPAHLPGHFPTAQEVTRLEKLERRRAQKRVVNKRWRDRHPEAVQRQIQSYHRTPQRVVYDAEYYRDHRDQPEFQNRRRLSNHNWREKKKATDPLYFERERQARQERLRKKSVPPVSPATTP